MLSRLTNVAYVGTFGHFGVELKGNHPAIIDQATFDTVQRLLSERKTQTCSKPNGNYLLSGLIRCGKCGSAMTGSHDKGRQYYMCRGAQQKGVSFCDLNIVRQREVMPYILDALEGYFKNPRFIERLRERLHKKVAGECRTADPARLEKQLATVSDRLVKAKRRLVECDADMLSTVQEAIRELRQQQDHLESAIKDARTPKATRILAADETVNEALKHFSELRKAIAKSDPVRQRELIRKSVERVVVWAEKRPSGKLNRYDLQRGVIALRLSNWPGP